MILYMRMSLPLMVRYRPKSFRWKLFIIHICKIPICLFLQKFKNFLLVYTTNLYMWPIRALANMQWVYYTCEKRSEGVHKCTGTVILAETLDSLDLNIIFEISSGKYL